MVPLPILGFHPKPRRCAKQSREPNPAFAPRPPDGGGGAWVQAMAKSRARAVYPYWGGYPYWGSRPKAIFTGVPPQTPAPYPLLGLSRPKPHRYAKPSREPTLLSLRDRLMAGEVPRSKRGKVTGRGGLSILGLTPQTPALREAIA